MLVGELERSLLEEFPKDQAESWDRTGMLVGDPRSEVKAVAVALDPTIESIRFARSQGANVLVTHHPLFLDPPQTVKPLAREGDAVGARVWEAVSAGVSVISFHTALDVSPHAAAVLSEPLALDLDGGILEPLEGKPRHGYGRLCEGGGITLMELADRCNAAFGRGIRVWGDAHRELKRICLWTGAAGESPSRCNDLRVDALVCGEVKYHEALDAAERGLCIVELGHDVSEQVHCGVLVKSIARAGVPASVTFMKSLPVNWR